MTLLKPLHVIVCVRKHPLMQLLEDAHILER